MLLRISPSFPGEISSFLKVDQKKKQVTLYDPTAISHVSQKYRRMGVAAPKMFAFDSIFEPDSSQVRNPKLFSSPVYTILLNLSCDLCLRPSYVVLPSLRFFSLL